MRLTAATRPMARGDPGGRVRVASKRAHAALRAEERVRQMRAIRITMGCEAVTAGRGRVGDGQILRDSLTVPAAHVRKLAEAEPRPVR